MNLSKAASNPKQLANGTHSLIDSFRKIIMKGIIMPPPPNPPALASIVINDSTSIPTYSINDRGNLNGVIGGFSNTSGYYSLVVLLD